MTTQLESKHLADLHALAGELEVSNFRMLTKAELVKEIGEAQAKREEEAAEEAKPRRLWGRRRRRKKEEAEAKSPEQKPEPEPEQPKAEPKRREQKRGQERREKPREKPEKDPPTRPVSGTLEVMPQRYGFLRLEGAEPGDADVYVSASQIRRCELRAGDQVEGPAREPRRGERHPALVRVEGVNGGPAEVENRPNFDALTPIPPHRPLKLDGAGDATGKLEELTLGQRVLIAGNAGSGRAALLRDVAGALPSSVEAVVLLIDDRPEEVSEWRRRAPEAELIALTADRRPAEQARIARLALARAKRRVEAGADVVIFVDSLSRLGLAYRDPVDVKTFFAAGRELEEDGTGSLTIIASVLTGDGTEADEKVYGAVKSTENLLVESG